MIYNRPEYWMSEKKMPKPDGEAYLTFISPDAFSIETGNKSKNWNGTLEYFTVYGTWAEWDGSSIQAKNGDDGYALYLRGTGNRVITGNSKNYKWSITGTDVQCIGNIETILDYATVESGNHPTKNTSCFSYMFYGCTALTTAPSLPATTLTDSCYSYMFYGCTRLTQAPSLPATTLKTSCYLSMFRGCTRLTQAPSLPAITLADDCYNCMFNDCTALTEPPSLPATTLVDACYKNMFYNCKKIKISSTETEEYTKAYRIPQSETGSMQSTSLTDMFTGTGGTFTGKPSINTTYYLSSSNTIV